MNVLQLYNICRTEQFFLLLVKLPYFLPCSFNLHWLIVTVKFDNYFLSYSLAWEIIIIFLLLVMILRASYISTAVYRESRFESKIRRIEAISLLWHILCEPRRISSVSPPFFRSAQPTSFSWKIRKRLLMLSLARSALSARVPERVAIPKH